jgi:hypothetical protein
VHFPDAPNDAPEWCAFKDILRGSGHKKSLKSNDLQAFDTI